MPRTILWAAALAAAAPAFASGQSGPQAPPPIVTVPTAPPPVLLPVDPAALAEARALLHDVDFDAQMGRTAREVAERTFETMIREVQTRLGQPVPAELRARVHTVLMENLAHVIEEMRPTALEDAARVYARYFTVSELQEIRRIQTNPVMTKLQRVSPQLLPELMQIGVAASARHMPELQAQLRQVIEQWQSEQEALRPHVS